MTKTEISDVNARARIKWEFGEPHFLYGYLKGKHAYTITLYAPNQYRLSGSRFRHIAEFESLKDAKEYADLLTILTTGQRAIIVAQLVGKRLDLSKIKSLMIDTVAATRSKKLLGEPCSKGLKEMLLSFRNEIDRQLENLC